MNDDNEKLHRNLVMLLKMFKNRPYHLSKYLVDNSAFNQDFISKILESDKLKDMSKDDEKSKTTPIHFNDINQMNDFYNSFIDEIKSLSKDKSEEDLIIDLNNKLDSCIKNENFEDASRIRDYMTRNGIKRTNNSNNI